MFEKKPFEADSELSLKMYFKKEYLDEVLTSNNKFNLNISYGIYESNSDEFFNLCNKYNYAPKRKIVEDKKYNI